MTESRAVEHAVAPGRERSIAGVAASKLGGSRVLGARVTTEADLARAIERGLPTGAIDALKGHGITEQEAARFVIPRRTLGHRRDKGQALSVEESDRAVRLARILALAEAAFANAEKAMTWLRRPSSALDDRAPLDVAGTDAGARVIENLLARITWGAAA